jgi:hypothetical protein
VSARSGQVQTGRSWSVRPAKSAFSSMGVAGEGSTAVRLLSVNWSGQPPPRAPSWEPETQEFCAPDGTWRRLSLSRTDFESAGSVSWCVPASLPIRAHPAAPMTAGDRRTTAILMGSEGLARDAAGPPKQGVAGSIPAGGTRSVCLSAHVHLPDDQPTQRQQNLVAGDVICIQERPSRGR